LVLAVQQVDFIVQAAEDGGDGFLFGELRKSKF